MTVLGFFLLQQNRRPAAGTAPRQWGPAIPLVLGIELPWVIEGVLQAIVLLPAFGLPYAVAVRHVFSPRTVLRQSLQYAFARRTLAALVVIPIVALAASLVQQRDQSLAMIVSPLRGATFENSRNQPSP